VQACEKQLLALAPPPLPAVNASIAVLDISYSARIVGAWGTA
jgi:hypothetical protein